MRIAYADRRVEKYFSDFNEMKKMIPAEWVRTIKKHLDRLSAADTFSDFLRLDLGHPEQLHGKDEGRYSVRVTGNVRLIIRLGDDDKDVTICEVVEIGGVVDYHGGKETWYIP